MARFDADIMEPVLNVAYLAVVMFPSCEERALRRNRRKKRGG